jgi:hypothetical protein
MSTCLSHLCCDERGLLLSGTDEPGIELSDQLEQLWREAEEEARETRAAEDEEIDE